MVKRKRVDKSIAELICDLDLFSTFARKNAIVRLAEKQAVEAIPRLSELCAGKDAILRACAAWALGEIGDRQASLDLHPLLKDVDTEVRRSAVRAVWVLGDPASEGVLKEATMDSDRWVAEQATKALASLDLGRKNISLEKTGSKIDPEIMELKA